MLEFQVGWRVVHLGSRLWKSRHTQVDRVPVYSELVMFFRLSELDLRLQGDVPPETCDLEVRKSDLRVQLERTTYIL